MQRRRQATTAHCEAMRPLSTSEGREGELHRCIGNLGQRRRRNGRGGDRKVTPVAAQGDRATRPQSFVDFIRIVPLTIGFGLD